jgi:signal transduction histidine kinase
MIDMKKAEILDLNESIRRTAKLAQNRIRRNRVQLDLKLSAKSPRVLADPGELTLALLEVLANAVDATYASRTSGKIQITSAVIRDHVLVSVMDDGPVQSTGARLSLRRSLDIIKEIGGDMWVSSGVSRGTRFTIELPSASLN